MVSMWEIIYLVECMEVEMRGNQKKMEKSSQGAMQGKQGRGEDCKLREEGVSGRGSGQLCLMMTTGEVG